MEIYFFVGERGNKLIEYPVVKNAMVGGRQKKRQSISCGKSYDIKQNNWGNLTEKMISEQGPGKGEGVCHVIYKGDTFKQS